MNKSPLPSVGSLPELEDENWDEADLTGEEDSMIWAWGQATLGRLGLGKTGQEDSKDSKVGTVWQAHWNPTPMPTKRGINWVKVSCGSSHSAAVTSDGCLYTWGSGTSHQLGYTKAIQTHPRKVEIAGISDVCAGNQHTLTLTDDGSSAYQFGRKFVSPQVRPKSCRFVSIAVGSWHNIALSESGTIFTWGGNEYGQLGHNNMEGALHPTPVVLDPADTGLKFVTIGGGARHSFAITDFGDLYTWGAGGYGQLGHNDPSQHQLIPKRVTHLPEGVKFVEVDGGTWHSVALTVDGEVYTWGAGGYGQLGHLGKEDLETLVLVPVKVPFPKNTIIVKVVAGDTFTLALDKGGNIWSWGSNLAGQLGYATTGPHQMALSPRQIPFPKHIVFADISAGASHALAVREIPPYLEMDMQHLLVGNSRQDFQVIFKETKYNLHYWLLKIVIPKTDSPKQLHKKFKKIPKSVTLKIFKLFLNYLYTLKISAPDTLTTTEFSEMKACAEAIGIPALSTWCDSYQDSLKSPLSALARKRITPHGPQALSTVLSSVLKDKSTCDFTIQVKGTLFQCHTAILVTRSKFFEAALRSNFSETQKGMMDLQLPYPSVSSFEAFLEYLYTNSCDGVHGLKLALSVYLNSSYLSLDAEPKHLKLISHCIAVIYRSVTNENCLSMLTKLHNANPSGKVKEKIIQYIVDHYEEVASLGELPLLPTQLFQEINVSFNLNVLQKFRALQRQMSLVTPNSATSAHPTPKAPGGGSVNLGSSPPDHRTGGLGAHGTHGAHGAHGDF
eukprot:TRINITY_DN7506_c0_g1_i2.p1 TRINITY_DN7506_c0_g1~~TRINITY_DN7506_c0_g1_i2.p1  ORF type:complete len:783 (+),score=106.99 TRINITY_DN7506_c0_g1_i2:14-2362(+)